MIFILYLYIKYRFLVVYKLLVVVWVFLNNFCNSRKSCILQNCINKGKYW